MNEQEYNAIHALRHSHAKVYAEKGAGYFHALRSGLVVQKETAALRLGTAIHMALLEPDRFASTYVIHPKIDRRRNEGKAAWAELEVEKAANPDKLWLPEDEHQQLIAMRDAVLASPLARKIIEACERVEQCHRWKDRIFGSGLEMKARLDLSSDRSPLVVDLKSTEDASPEGFSKSVVKYCYDTQAVWYLSGEADRKGVPLDELTYVVIAVEKTYPFRVGIYELSAVKKWMGVAAAWCRRTLGEIADRTARDDWRDAWNGVRADLEPPRWYAEARGLK
jgi:hypothetical protein